VRFPLPADEPSLAVGTTFESIPARVPYLAAEPDRIEHWRRRIGKDGFRIGVCWSGSAINRDQARSFPLARLDRVARRQGVRLIRLQKGEGSGQIASLPQAMSVEALGDDFDSGPDAFLDTAAALHSLDLVISCDTAVVHLAGALARPTWLAVKHVADSRWLRHRSDSPWYPTLRLFRQPARGDWRAVFQSVEAALQQSRASSLMPPAA
jgi:hypothetical protein